MSCVAPPTGAGFLDATLANLDCQAQTIGEAGYQALASPGSPLSPALTVLLAIFVAVIGMRFLTGRPLGVNEWISGTLKMGFVLALASSWPAYRTVIYDIVLKGPAEISGLIGTASALPGSDGGLTARLQGVDDGIMALVEAGSGRLDVASQRPAGAIAPPLADDTALGWGKTLFVGSVIGNLGLLRIAAGIFLALAPFFAGFLLFSATRFLFFGWLRSLIAVAVGSLGISVVLGVQLAIIEPWLAQVLALRASRIATLSAPFELLALTLAFAFAMLGVIALALRIAFATSVGTRAEAVIERASHALQIEASQWRPFHPEANDNLSGQTRAQIIAQSLRQVPHSDSQNASGVVIGGTSRNRTLKVSDARSAIEASPYVPLGRSHHASSRRINNHVLKRKTTA